jgi:hypothetical protein
MADLVSLVAHLDSLIADLVSHDTTGYAGPLTRFKGMEMIRRCRCITDAQMLTCLERGEDEIIKPA